MDWSFLINNKDAICVSTDTRNLPSGCVFFALKGENFDGNQFAQQALANGASLAIIDDPKAFIGPQTILVPNTLKALQSLARAWRRELGLPILCITGTNGKTTTKELTAAVLKTKYRIHYTQGNLNNSIGVPLTLLQLTRAHEMAIVECGASHPGDIKELVDIAEPNYGLITNVGRAHLQGFGSFEGVQATKRELYDYLVAHNGLIFRNEDNDLLTKMWQAANVEGRPTVDRQSAVGRPWVGYHTGRMPEGTHLVGDYNSENVQAALTVGEYFGISRETGLEAIRAYVPTNNRSQLMHTATNTLVVDAYNANPTSMQAAIGAFDAQNQKLNNGNETNQNTTRAYILGSMRELGDYTHLEHQNIANMLLERKADIVLLVGTEWRDTTAPYPIFDTVDELADYLREHPIRNATVLVKGSRSNKLEKIIPSL